MHTFQMEAIAASTTIKGKAPAHMPVKMTQTPSSYSSASSGLPSDNEEDAYFSDASTSSVTSATSSSLGDFIFDNDEEYADYFEIVERTIKGKGASGENVATSSYSSARSSKVASASYRSSDSSKKNQTKSSYRKSTSSFFLSGSSFPSTLQLRIPPSLAAQNPALNKASQSLSSKVSKLNSYFPRERAVSQSGSEDDMSACESCDEINVDERFERAMMFAQWSKRGNAGQWQAPEHVNGGLIKLVASIQ